MNNPSDYVKNARENIKNEFENLDDRFKDEFNRRQRKMVGITFVAALVIGFILGAVIS